MEIDNPSWSFPNCHYCGDKCKYGETVTRKAGFETLNFCTYYCADCWEEDADWNLDHADSMGFGDR